MTVATVSSQPQSSAKQITEVLSTLASCLSTAESSLPAASQNEPLVISIEPPSDGISLLDTKNELLLSYLHNLVFLIIFQLRQVSSSSGQRSHTDDLNGHGRADVDSLQDNLVRKLIELRVYLSRGVRPLETRLKYQVDKVVKAAEDAERAERNTRTIAKKTAKGTDSGEYSSEDSGSHEEDTGDDSGSDVIDEMAYRPNISAFSKRVESQVTQPEKSAKNVAKSGGIYRPPQIMPTAMPTTEHRDRVDRRPRKSNVIDEFVAAEISSVPMAEPSIGSTILRGGRHTKTQKDREYEAERRRYEETNFVRLPKESKKERAKQGRRGLESSFGGEEWRGLGEGADRIARLTQSAKGRGGALEKSRKRRLTEDGPRSDGASVGQVFEKRRKKIESWKR